MLPFVIAALAGANELYRARKEKKEITKEAEREDIATQEKKRITRSRVDSILAEQQAGFLKSGAKMTGTPLEVMSDTLRKGSEDIANIDRSSRADSLRKMAKRAGRAGVTNALGTFLTTYLTAGAKVA